MLTYSVGFTHDLVPHFHSEHANLEHVECDEIQTAQHDLWDLLVCVFADIEHPSTPDDCHLIQTVLPQQTGPADALSLVPLLLTLSFIDFNGDQDKPSPTVFLSAFYHTPCIEAQALRGPPTA